MFFTSPDSETAAAQASQVIAMRQAAQQLRVVEEWEPRIAASLAGLPGLCLTALLRVLESQASAGTRSSGHDDDARVLDALHALAMESQARAQALLEEMVRAESRALVENLSLRGLLGEMPDTSDWPRRLAGAEALAESFQRSWREFRERVEAELHTEDQDPSLTAVGLERHAQWWEGRLATIAVTLTHAAMNRVRKETSLEVDDYTPEGNEIVRG